MDSLDVKEVPYDENMKIMDFMKINNPMYSHAAFNTLDVFKKQAKRMPICWDLNDMK